MIKKFIFKRRQKWAKERSDFFLREMELIPGMKILDLGGSDGVFMDRIKDKLPGIRIAISDLDKNALQKAALKGYETILMDGSAEFPFKDKEFDCIFCNSVIEHVTISKDEIWKIKKTSEFYKKSLESQSFFANEIIRCSKKYFIQTPHKYFPIESHSWFPFITFLSRPIQIRLIKLLNRFWIKKTAPDWNLLTKNDMKLLFPNANVFINRKIGFPKEIIALKK